MNDIYDRLAEIWKMSRHDTKKQVYAALCGHVRDHRRERLLKDIYVNVFKGERNATSERE